MRPHDFLPAFRRGDTYFPAFSDLFDTFFGPARPNGDAVIKPALDLQETADEYGLKVDVPGYSMDNIDIQLSDNTLMVSGKMPEEVVETTENGKKGDVKWHVVERKSGSFNRTIKFPIAVDATKVKASLKSGVLTVTVPKAAAAKAQKIRISEN